MFRVLRCLVVFLFCSFSYQIAFASDFFSSDKTVYLIDKAGQETPIARVSFERDHTGAYQFELNEAAFSEHFLSMRPFSCLTHPNQLVCHLPYIYPIARRVTADSLADLEYDLMFLHKTPQEYGINAWNGLYYQLSWQDDQIVGELKEVDLNVLVSPPPEGEMRPVKGHMLHDAQKNKHAYPTLIIR